MPQPHLRDIRPVLLKNLQQAAQSIEAAVAWFTDEAIFDLLLQRLRTGTTVTLVLNDDLINHQTPFEWPEFTRLGGRAYYFRDDTGGTMHHKFCVIDGETLLLGSYNWTYRAANRNRENLIVLTQTDGIDTAPFRQELAELVRLSRPICEPEPPQPEPLSTALVLNPSLGLLRVRIRTLEVEIAVLEEQKQQREGVLTQYQHLIRVHLGDLLTDIADLKARIAEREAMQSGRRSDAERAENLRSASEQTYRHVADAVANPLPDLNNDDQTELRRLFRKAAAQAHPDRFINDPARCQQATAFMARLNTAYAQKDLTTLRQLMADLDEGRVFDTALETITDRTLLEKRLARLLALKAQLLAQIETIEQDEAYGWMTAEGDIHERLMALREELSKQKEALTCAL
ncbi:MAG: DUF1669 domain-containing protein [Cytophagales bacterium]|nr:MAG: DUF1669 domain-containing protein [Cytophagales bacterium]